MHRSTLLLPFLLVATSLGAQVQHRSIETAAFAGRMLDIYPGFPERNAHFGATLSWLRSKKSVPNAVYGNPETGFCLSLHEFGNAKVFGLGLGLQHEFRFQQKLREKWVLVERLRTGIILQSGRYHYIDNRQNIVNGSAASFLMSACVGVHRSLGTRASLGLDATVWHSSNGHTALPNVGMNSPVILLTYRWQFADLLPTDSVESKTEVTAHKQRGPSLYLGFGLNEAGGTVRPVNGERYAKYLMSVAWHWRVGKAQKISIALDGYYDRTNRLWNEVMEWPAQRPVLQSSVLALFVGHEFVHEHLGLLIQGGVNLYNPTLQRIRGVEKQGLTNSIKSYVPGRVAMRYYVCNLWKNGSSPYVQVAIKSHFGQADFLEVGVGWEFGKR